MVISNNSRSENLRNGTQIRPQELLMIVKDLESITIDFKLSTVKSLHAKWVMEAYNHMTSSIGKDICSKGCKKSGIQEALKNGMQDNLDLFKDIDPIETADEVGKSLFLINKMYISQQNLDDDDSD